MSLNRIAFAYPQPLTLRSSVAILLSALLLGIGNPVSAVNKTSPPP